jgi:hypothetical protein
VIREAAACALVLVLVVGLSARAAAQPLPTEPVSIGGGRLVLGAELSATTAPEDPGFFNYTDYEYSALRNIRLGLAAEVRATERLQLLAEVRLDHGRTFQPYGFYVRIRPWPARRFDIQVGRVPPTFGTFARRTYAAGNLLIGTPLAYQYLTSLRSDAVPADADELFAMRGRGWLSSFSVGNPVPQTGLPLVNGLRWDTGVQVHGVNGAFEWTTAITTGSLSNPRVDDDNGGRQIAGRVVWRPGPALVVGVSAARGAYLSRSLRRALPDVTIDDLTQRALGADVEYSAGRALVRGELVWSRWTVPALASSLADPLAATSVLVEGRYRLWPGLYAAARGERLGFSTIAGTRQRLEWDAPVVRYEAGVGWSITRNVMLKGSWQINQRRAGRVRRDSLGAAQLLYWF